MQKIYWIHIGIDMRETNAAVGLWVKLFTHNPKTDKK